MNDKNKVFTSEFQKALYWLSRNQDQWQYILGTSGSELSAEEFSNTLYTFIDGKQYIPLVVFLANDFLNIDTSRILKRILIDILIKQWNDNTWDEIANITKQATAEYLEAEDNWHKQINN